jgi:hypothetical protein
MSEDFTEVTPARRKCARCGLVNTGADAVCRRCGTSFDEESFEKREGPEAEPEPRAIPVEQVAIYKPKRRPLLKRVTWILGTTAVLLIVFYASLLLSANRLEADERDQVQSAIKLIKERGFTREAFILDHVASFRRSDNWLNAYVGHRDAYAATNFPFEIVTLYDEFFDVPVDDCERAAVLLHEARHLLGDQEDAALEYTWKNKNQLGWTTQKYKNTRLWDATMRLTKAQFPYMFECGGDGQSDCL